jgi:methyltransferase (TIGR00027 family)
MENRIEKKSSRTAQIMCFIRAASFYEEEPCLKTNDYIAPQLLPKKIRPIAKIRMLRKAFMRFTPPGAYEYVIARTRFIDRVVEDSVKSDITQIVLLGAGFDSRSIRFHRPGSGIRFFELDAPITQASKVTGLQKRGIGVLRNTVYIPINFNKEDFSEKLKERGFRADKRSLFILEGITMYLEEEAIRSTLETIKSISGPRSRIVADFIYQSVLRKENTLYGEQAIYQRINKYNEAWRFGIEKGEIGPFMEGLGLKLLKIRSPGDLEEAYHFGSHRINGTHFIAIAESP